LILYRQNFLFRRIFHGENGRKVNNNFPKTLSKILCIFHDFRSFVVKVC
jgi:hypothetical protein